MTNNRLKLNESKNDTMVISQKQIPQTLLGDIMSSSFLKNLGVVLDNTMSMKQHIGAVCKSLYFQIRKISSIRAYLTEEVTQKLVTSLILSKLDYSNALLAGLPQNTLNPLQLAQNNAARLIFRIRKNDHVTPLLKDLHWLPVNERIIFKVCVYCYKCINVLAPEYLTSTIQTYKLSRALRSAFDQTILVKTSINYKY